MTNLEKEDLRNALDLHTKSQSTQVEENQLQKGDDRKGLDNDTNHLDVEFLWSVYRNSATIHGISQTSGPHVYSFRRKIWLILIIGMASLLGKMLFDQVSYLSGYPIKTKVMVEFVSQVAFPSVTICNLNQFHRDRVPDNDSIKTVIFDSSEINSIPWDATPSRPAIPLDINESGQDLLNFSRYAAHRLSDMFILCEWRGTVYPCQNLLVPKMTTFGHCYTFNGNDTEPHIVTNVGPFQGLRILIDIEQYGYYYSETMKAGIKVVVGAPNETPFPDREGWTVRPGVAAYAAVSIEQKTGLPWPYKAVGNSSCLDPESPNVVNRLKRYEYKPNACMVECFLDILIQKCNCTHFFDTGFRNGTGPRLCSAREIIQCYLPERKKRGNNNCNCPWSCKMRTYQPTMSYADISSLFLESLIARQRIIDDDASFVRNNIIDLNIHLSTMGIHKIDQEPDSSLGQIVANIGGHLGLFLGASLLSIVELLEILVLLTCKIGRKLVNSLKKCASLFDKIFDREKTTSNESPR